MGSIWNAAKKGKEKRDKKLLQDKLYIKYKIRKIILGKLEKVEDQFENEYNKYVPNLLQFRYYIKEMGGNINTHELKELLSKIAEELANEFDLVIEIGVILTSQGIVLEITCSEKENNEVNK